MLLFRYNIVPVEEVGRTYTT